MKKTAHEQTVFISTTSFGEYSQEPVQILEKAGLIVRPNPLKRKLNSGEISKFISDIDFLIAGTEDLNRSVLENAPRLRIISRCGVGLDNVDLKAAKEKGIKVLNTPHGPTTAVAELTIGLMLDLLRHISSMDKEIRSGQWKKKMGSLLRNKRIGIIGFGQIGKEVANLCRAFGAQICFYDPAFIDVCTIKDKNFKRTNVEILGSHSVIGKEKTNKGQLVKESGYLELPKLLEQSDIVTLHLSYSKENHHLIGVKELSMMKKGAFLVNCARGGLVDEEALLKALKDGKIAGAALDVFENEPYQGPLKGCDNVILTPHIGSYAKEARIQMEIDAANNLIDALKEI